MLLTAATSNNKTAVMTLVKHGADTNIADSQGKTTLHYLLENSADVEFLKDLVTDVKTDVNQGDGKG